MSPPTRRSYLFLKHFKLDLFTLFYAWVFCLHLRMWTMWSWCSWRSEKGVGSLELELEVATGKPSCVCWEPSPVLSRATVLLLSEPSLRPHIGSWYLAWTREEDSYPENVGNAFVCRSPQPSVITLARYKCWKTFDWLQVFVYRLLFEGILVVALIFIFWIWQTVTIWKRS